MASGPRIEPLLPPPLQSLAYADNFHNLFEILDSPRSSLSDDTAIKAGDVMAQRQRDSACEVTEPLKPPTPEREEAPPPSPPPLQDKKSSLTYPPAALGFRAWVHQGPFSV